MDWSGKINQQEEPMTSRKYPPFFEKAVPIAIIVIGILTLVLLAVIAVVLNQS